MRYIILCLLVSVINLSFAQTKVTFPSLDSLDITADVYHVGDKNPVILLCHQAGYSRGEYIEVVQVLNTFGFNCIAVDQRSGNAVNGIENETAKRAIERGLIVKAPEDRNDVVDGFLSAEQDIIAAIEYVYQKYNQPILLLGSSYSASLVLKVAVKNDKVKAVISFSPGEYFGEKLHLEEAIKELDKPAFVTSSLKESKLVGKLIEGIDSDKLVHFTPQKGEGVHGSRSLWKSNDNGAEYWEALVQFLTPLR